MYDLVIKQGKIVDGTGATGYIADIAIKDGKIAKIAHKINDPAARVIEAAGLVVTPGFIDMHSHSDGTCLFNKTAHNYLQQGVTTEVMGHCGSSLVPYSEVMEEMYASMFEETDPELVGVFRQLTSIKAFFDYIDQNGNGTNVAMFVGHGNLRVAAMGMANRKPTDAEMEHMKQILRQAMIDGARGMSTGLIYPPGVYAETEELIELSKVVAEYGGTYCTHMRNESGRIEHSIREVMRIAREANIAANISHLKVADPTNWGRSGEVLGLLDYANMSGLELSADQYPYPAGSTALVNILPPWNAADGREALIAKINDPHQREIIKQEILNNVNPGWENFFLSCGAANILISTPKVECAKNTIYLDKYAEVMGMEPIDALFDVLSKDIDTSGVYFMMNEYDIEKFMCHPYVMGGTDGMVQTRPGAGNLPRSFATFPRIIGTYARDRRLMRLEECIRKLTSLPANKARLYSKGVIKPLLDADLVIFDYATIKDNSWFGKVEAANDGIHYVIVNGSIAVEDGKVTGALAGRAIR